MHVFSNASGLGVSYVFSLPYTISNGQKANLGFYIASTVHGQAMDITDFTGAEPVDITMGVLYMSGPDGTVYECTYSPLAQLSWHM